MDIAAAYEEPIDIDIGPEKKPFIAEPLEDPFKRPVPAPPSVPEPKPEPVKT